MRNSITVIGCRPKISVVIPVGNCMPYLKLTLNSILNQSLRDIEVIAVVNNSTDGSLELLRQRQKEDSRLKILVSEESGAALARNLGMKYASGKYISFLDGDDFFEPNMLQLMYEKIETSSSDICICGADVFNEASSINNNRPFFPVTAGVFSKSDISHKVFEFCSHPPWDKLYSKDFIDVYQLEFQNQPASNDVYFTQMSIFLARRICVIDDMLVHYRIGGGNSTQDKAAKHAICGINAATEVRKDVMQLGAPIKTLQSLNRFGFTCFCASAINASKAIDYSPYIGQLASYWEVWGFESMEMRGLSLPYRLLYRAIKNVGFEQLLYFLRNGIAAKPRYSRWKLGEYIVNGVKLLWLAVKPVSTT